MPAAGAFRADRSAVQLDQLAADGQPQPEATMGGVDYVRRVVEIGALVNDLVNEDAEERTGALEDAEDIVEGSTAALRLDRRAPPSPLICPDCGGALWQVEEGNLLRFRCQVGHGYTAETLNLQMSDEVEQSLWCAVRVLEVQSELQERMALRTAGDKLLQSRFQASARERQETADLIRALITGQPIDNGGAAKSAVVRQEYGAGA